LCHTDFVQAIVDKREFENLFRVRREFDMHDRIQSLSLARLV